MLYPFCRAPSSNTNLWHLFFTTIIVICNTSSPKLRENHMQKDSYFFNLLLIPTTYNQLWFVKDWNCIHTILDDRWLDMMLLNVGIPYLYLRDIIASSTIKSASLVSWAWRFISASLKSCDALTAACIASSHLSKLCLGWPALVLLFTEWLWGRYVFKLEI